LDRRDFIKSATGIITSVAFPNIVLAKDKGKYERSLNLFNPNTHESVNTVYFANGKYVFDGLVELDYLFRDFRDEETVAIDVTLYELIYVLQLYSDKKYALSIGSGFRTKKTNKLLKEVYNYKVSDNSYHLVAKAGDLSVHPKSKVSLYQLKEKALKIGIGGVGYYPKLRSLHIDTGKIRSWRS